MTTTWTVQDDAADTVERERLDRLRRLADLLDSRWRIPGLGVPIGIDGIASVVPGVGDTLTALVSAYLVREAVRFGLPSRIVVRMAGNVGVDWLVGSIPLLGTIFDIGFKANRRNVGMLIQHLEERAEAAGGRPAEWLHRDA